MRVNNWKACSTWRSFIRAPSSSVIAVPPKPLCCTRIRWIFSDRTWMSRPWVPTAPCRSNSFRPTFTPATCSPFAPIRLIPGLRPILTGSSYLAMEQVRRRLLEPGGGGFAGSGGQNQSRAGKNHVGEWGAQSSQRRGRES